MSAMLALSKGRAAHGGLLQLCRRACALCLAADVQCSWRWLASELNPADEASRIFDVGAAPDGPPQGQARARDHGAPGARGGGRTGGVEAQPTGAGGSCSGVAPDVVKVHRPPPGLEHLVPRRPDEQRGALGTGCEYSEAEAGSGAKGEAGADPPGQGGREGERLRAGRQQGRCGVLGGLHPSAAARRSYAKLLDEFWAFASEFKLDVSDERNVDRALCDYADLLYLRGEQAHAGPRLWAAMRHRFPGLGKASRDNCRCSCRYCGAGAEWRPGTCATQSRRR